MVQQPVPGHLQVGDVVRRAPRCGWRPSPRWAPRPARAGSACRRPGGTAPSSRGSPPMPGRPMNPLLHTSCRQVTIRPDGVQAGRQPGQHGRARPAPSPARPRGTTAPAPGGRATARASSTASAAASSEALCPYTPAPSTWCTVSCAGSRPSPAASAPRSGNTPWLCVHTVTAAAVDRRPSGRSRSSAPSSACAMNGRVYSACAGAADLRRRGPGRARRTTGWSSVGCGQQEALQVASSGSDSRTVHRAARASRAARGHRDPVLARPARRGTSRRAARPPRRPAGRPARRRPAWRPGRAAGSPGRTASPAAPGRAGTGAARSTLSGRSIRGALRPATDHWLAGLAAATGHRRPGPAGPARPATSS